MNNYHIYDEIGKGKYSVVYKGRKKKTIEYMAVKSLEKSRRTKLLNEVKMFSGLKHPNILKFYHWYETRNHLWVILEYCPGGDLMALIEADQQGLQENIVLRFVRDMAAGLNYLHSKGIIYCDLRPSNVLFNEYGVAKLSDLGNAKRLVDMISATIGPDVEMSKRGSPYYMAPELFHEGGVYSFQSDLWALGCIAYELCIGQPPFQCSSFTELVELILNAEVKPLEVQCWDFIKGLLEKDPLKRWGWEKICKFLNIQYLNVPSQPHFETWCKKNNLVRVTPVQQNNKQVDIVRLSLNVHKNMLREDVPSSSQQQQYHKQISSNEKDFKLTNKDQEILIGSEQQQEDEEIDKQPEEFQTNVQSDLNSINSPHLQQKPFTIKKDSVHPSTQSLLNQSPIPGGITPQQKKGNENDQLTPIDQLFTHSSDNSVKPIIGNREIEKSIDATFAKESLPFQYINSDDVNRNIETDQIEFHFEQIYNSLQVAKQQEQLNILNYFEQIIQTSNAANRLINSAYVQLLLKLLTVSKLTQLKYRICCVLGLLIRHATVIEPEVSQHGIPEAMVEILNSKEQSTVRRKAAAALGEYLFYGATQMEEDPQNPYWKMSNLSFNQLIKVIKSQNEDEIVKFYCIKTIENISSQSISIGQRFAKSEIVLMILQCFLSTKNDSLRISCAITLANLLMLDNQQVDVFMQSLGLKSLVSIFLDNLQRVQQAMITIFNIHLLQSVSTQDSSSNNVSQLASNAVNKLLMEESQLIKGLVYLLDHGNAVSRGKAAIALMLMIKFNIVTLINLSEEQLRFYQILDKGLRDNNDYLKQCLQHLVQQLCDCTPIMITQINQSLTDSQLMEYSPKKTNGNYLNVLFQYSQTPVLQQSLFSSQYLPILTELLSLSKNKTQIQTTLLNIMSKMCTNSKILIKQQQVIIQQVLKNCIDYMVKQQSTETKFMFLKLIIDLLSALLQEEGIYDYPNFLKPYSNELNNIITTLILPLLKELFQEQPPLPFYALKLASILLTYNSLFLPHFKRHEVLQAILDMYKPDSNNITGHTLNIIQKIVEGSSIEDLKQLQIIDKSLQIFVQFTKQKQEWAFEDLSSIMVAITSKIINELQRGNNKIVVSPDNTLIPQPFPQEFLFFQDQFYFTLQYAQQIINIATPGCQLTLLTYMLHLTYFYPGKLSQIRQQLFNQLIPLLCPQLNKRIIKLLHWVVVLNEQKPFKIEKKEILVQVLDKYQKEDKSIAMAAKDLIKYLL
ncbi:unnamed protein product [Paramecium pentaurelia]|uniref:Protein kinase domain-containing protein n=1 Tax=Paramecium pentaurelia TaxID=43138 RepID=A0A8S1TRG9_9CILI|nr:unnamed protein product [Paramecium pentaurelia]